MKNLTASHTADSHKKGRTERAHSTDAYMSARITRHLPKPELSKNSTILISLSDGQSTMVGFLTITTWNTPGRPKKPRKGTIGFNTQTLSLEIWDGNYWFTTALNPV